MKQFLDKLVKKGYIDYIIEELKKDQYILRVGMGPIEFHKKLTDRKGELIPEQLNQAKENFYNEVIEDMVKKYGENLIK